MSDVTICIKSFERENSVNRLISQLRGAKLGAKIIVADDSMKPLDIRGADELLRLPFDIGLSAGRNAMVRAIDTPYMILMDDDNTIYSRTDFDLMYRTIKETDFNIVGGQMGRNPYYGLVEIVGSEIEIYIEAWRDVKFGHKVIDFCDNFFIAETQIVLDNPWDEKIKISCEHLDFFMQGKKSGDFKVCRVRSFVGNDSLAENLETVAHYERFRRRGKLYEQIFNEKWGITGSIKMSNKSLLDLRG